jgi:hypothetical protein
MRNSLRRQGGRNPLPIALRLKRIDDLFAAPDLTPFDPAFAPSSFGPGIDYVVQEMERRPDAERVELTLILPADEIAAEPDLEARTREAVARYARAWLAVREQQREVAVRQAWAVAGSAILFFAVANFLSLQYAQDGSLFGLTGDVIDVLLDGLGVAAWVALWWPFDQLFQRWQGRLEERTYQSLPGIAVQVLPAPVSSFDLAPPSPGG